MAYGTNVIVSYGMRSLPYDTIIGGINQSRGTLDLNPVKTYNYIPIRSGFRKELYQNYFLDLNNSSVPRFVIFAIIHSILIWLFIDLERV